MLAEELNDHERWGPVHSGHAWNSSVKYAIATATQQTFVIIIPIILPHFIY